MNDKRGLKICGECGSVNVAPVYPGSFECDDCGSSLVVEVCGFCRGKPVGDAASWLDGKPRPPAPCPRCGETAVVA